MTLRTRTILVLGMTLLLLVGTTWVISWGILQNGFDALEHAHMEHELARVKRSLAREFEALDATVHDNASWDAAYAYLRDGDPNFFAENTKPETLDNLGIDVLLTATPDATLRQGTFKSATAETWGDLPDGLYSELRDAVQQTLNASAPPRGLLQSSVGLLMFAARPVLPSNEHGSPTGVLLMGTFLSAAQIKALADVTQIDLAIRALAAPTLPEDFAQARTKLAAAPQTSLISPVDASAIEAFDVLRDYADQPVALLKIAQPRPIHDQGRQSVILLAMGLITSAVGFLVATLYGLDRLVLRRLASVTGAAHQIAHSTDFRARIPVDRADELGQLSTVINEMLKSLGAQLKLEKALAAAENAGAAKSIFLSKMSHELRTPLNAIMGFGQLLEERLKGNGDSVGAMDAAEVVAASERLTRLVSDVLDYTNIESGRMGLTRGPFALRECVESAVAAVASDAAQKALVLSVNIAPDVPATISGDAVRVRQVLLNLLNNAVRFTDRGDINLNVTVQPQSGTAAPADAQRTELLFQVADTGIGIPPEHVSTLFTIFNQVDNSKARRYDGSGLGLALSKQLCAMMGGEIWVTSAPGEGSTFSFTIRDAGSAATHEATA